MHGGSGAKFRCVVTCLDIEIRKHWPCPGRLNCLYHRFCTGLGYNRIGFLLPARLCTPYSPYDFRTFPGNLASMLNLGSADHHRLLALDGSVGGALVSHSRDSIFNSGTCPNRPRSSYAKLSNYSFPYGKKPHQSLKPPPLK